MHSSKTIHNNFSPDLDELRKMVVGGTKKDFVWYQDFCLVKRYQPPDRNLRVDQCELKHATDSFLSALGSGIKPWPGPEGT